MIHYWSNVAWRGFAVLALAWWGYVAVEAAARRWWKGAKDGQPGTSD